MSLTGSDILEAHLLMMCTGFLSSEVVVDGVTMRGLLKDDETLGQDASGDIIRNRTRVLILPVASLTSIPTRDSSLTVDGVSYKVRSPLPGTMRKVVRIEVA
jgi:hypothetical protein